MKKRFIDTLKYLGPDYGRKMIDLELVIYRNLDNGFDFEISGLNDSKRLYKATIYVWKNTKSIIETISGIKSKEALKETMDNLVIKYSAIH